MILFKKLHEKRLKGEGPDDQFPLAPISHFVSQNFAFFLTGHHCVLYDTTNMTKVLQVRFPGGTHLPTTNRLTNRCQMIHPFIACHDSNLFFWVFVGGNVEKFSWFNYVENTIHCPEKDRNDELLIEKCIHSYAIWKDYILYTLENDLHLWYRDVHRMKKVKSVLLSNIKQGVKIQVEIMIIYKDTLYLNQPSSLTITGWDLNSDTCIESFNYGKLSDKKVDLFSVHALDDESLILDIVDVETDFNHIHSVIHLDCKRNVVKRLDFKTRPITYDKNIKIGILERFMVVLSSDEDRNFQLNVYRMTKYEFIPIFHLDNPWERENHIDLAKSREARFDDFILLPTGKIYVLKNKGWVLVFECPFGRLKIERSSDRRNLMDLTVAFS